MIHWQTLPMRMVCKGARACQNDMRASVQCDIGSHHELNACFPDIVPPFKGLCITFGDMKTFLKASGRRLMPTANMRNPRPGAYIPGVNLRTDSVNHYAAGIRAVTLGSGIRTCKIRGEWHWHRMIKIQECLAQTVLTMRMTRG